MAINLFEKATAEAKEAAVALLRKSGSADQAEAYEAQKALAAEIQTPIRQGILSGDIIGGIFTPTVFDVNAKIDYPTDLFRPDNDSEYVAYTIPNQGRIPERQVESDYVTVPTYDIGAGIDFLIRYAKEARFDVVARALEVLEAGFTKKLNDDGWHVILYAGVDRNILVTDGNAAAGQFTKRLVSLMQNVMRRNSGGNSTSMNRGTLTHLFVSPEAIEDVRNWGLDQIDDVTRKQIYDAPDGGINKIYGVALVDLDELGVSQEYQTFYTTTLSASMGTSDTEVCVGLDLSRKDSFVMPIREPLEIFADPTLHRSRRAGFYAWLSAGMAALDNRRVILGSM